MPLRAATRPPTWPQLVRGGPRDGHAVGAGHGCACCAASAMCSRCPASRAAGRHLCGAPVQPARCAPTSRAQRVVQTTRRARPGAWTSACGARRRPRAEPASSASTACTRATSTAPEGLYHINAVDCLTQWQVVASVQTLSEAHLLPVIEQMLEQFPFVILGFHADNPRGRGPAPSAASTSTTWWRDCWTSCASSSPAAARATAVDNGLAETRNGAVVRNEFGYAHIPQRHAARLQHLLLRAPEPVPELPPAVPVLDRRRRPEEARALSKRVYRPRDAMTPLDKLTSLAEANRGLRRRRLARTPARTGHGAHRCAGGRGTQRGALGLVPPRARPHRLKHCGGRRHTSRQGSVDIWSAPGDRQGATSSAQTESLEGHALVAAEGSFAPSP